jgi:hypothetical protein
MDEFEESREKGNLTAEILNREKVIKKFGRQLKIISFKNHF